MCRSLGEFSIWSFWFWEHRCPCCFGGLYSQLQAWGSGQCKWVTGQDIDKLHSKDLVNSRTNFFLSSLDPTGPASSVSAKQWIMGWVTTSASWRLTLFLPSRGSRALWIHSLLHLIAASVNIVITARKPESETWTSALPFLAPWNNQCQLYVLLNKPLWVILPFTKVHCLEKSLYTPCNSEIKASGS